MEFDALLDFIQTRMRMAHIYQPVMIRTLLDNRGGKRILLGGLGLKIRSEKTIAIIKIEYRIRYPHRTPNYP